MSAGIDLVNQPIVIDNGSGTVKAGFAGDQVPKCIFPNFIGRTKHVRVMAGGLEGDVFIGQKAEEHRGLLSLRYPMEHGIVHDWNDMERIWQHIFSKEQLHTFSEEHPILLTGQSFSCVHSPTKSYFLFEQKRLSIHDRIEKKRPKYFSRHSMCRLFSFRCRQSSVCMQPAE